MDKLSLDEKSLKKFGFTMGTAFSIITALVFWRHRISPLPFATVALLFLFFGKILPQALKPVYIVWMRLAFILSWVNTRLILILIFYLVFFPVATVLRLLGKDPLERRIEKGRMSYWSKREPSPGGSAHYERQF